MRLNPLNPAAVDVIVIGGGFSGCCMAVNLVRHSQKALAVSIIEPRAGLGQGMAYSTLDPDHRLNGPSFVHTLIPEDAWHFARWCAAQELDQSDPESVVQEGVIYPRRADFARYIAHTVREHAHWPQTGSIISHVQDCALTLRVGDSRSHRYEVLTQNGQTLRARLVVVASGNHLPSLPPYLNVGPDGHSAVVANVFDGQALKGIDRQARVLVVGAGLTALDALSTLVRQGHSGPIEVVSRHGQRPRSPGPVPRALARAGVALGDATFHDRFLLDRILGPAPAYLSDPQLPRSASAWLRAVRQQIGIATSEGKSWQASFDEARDAVWQLWPSLPPHEKRRFLRWVRPWYDAHRYRTPPQNEAMVRAAETQGQICYRAARVVNARPAKLGSIEVELLDRGAHASRHEAFDVLVNCAGLDSNAGLYANPFLAGLLKAQSIRPDACGLGVDVDARCQAFNGQGQAQAGLRFIGPPTLGSCGDAVGAMFIAAQIYRTIPDILQTLET